jgi:hypothetical protein
MFQRYALLFATALVLVAPLSAQQRTKIDLVLRAYLDGVHAADAQVDLFIHGSAAAVAQAVRTHGGVVKMSTGRITSARIPVARVEALAAEVAVERFEFSLDPGQVFNDTMRVRNRIDLVHAGQAPLPQAYDGTGVVVGIIDSGLDHTHGDFKDANGRTRIVKYWDQTLPFNAQLTPQPYGYGQVWDSTMINNGQMTSVDQPGLNGHGTTVTGTAAGNGLANGRHKGAAPGSSIIVVSSKFNSPNWRSVVADGVKYILDEAEAMGKPAVINASLGTYYGSHDGKDAAALLIDSMLTARGGRAMVCAIGNSNQFLPYHLRTEVTPDSAFTWFRYNPNLTFNGQQYGFVFFEVWADLADFANVQYAVGADRKHTLPHHRRQPGQRDHRHAQEQQRPTPRGGAVLRGPARRSDPAPGGDGAARFQCLQLPLHDHRHRPLRCVEQPADRQRLPDGHRHSPRGHLPAHRQVRAARPQQTPGGQLGLLGQSGHRGQPLQRGVLHRCERQPADRARHARCHHHQQQPRAHTR